jgi:transitional endoplasmic reticulum ATPase
MSDEVKINVGQLTGRGDFGRGVARIGSNIMKKLGIKEGDIVEINNVAPAVAVRSYPADVGREVMRIDGLVRKNANASIGEPATVRKADVKEAKLVKLAPAQEGLIFRVSPNLIKQNLFMRPMSKGDLIIANPVFKRKEQSNEMDPIQDMLKQIGFNVNFNEVFIGGGETRLMVVSTKPEGVVQITDVTEIEMLEQAVKVEEGKLASVTYEDIGGLGDATKKVREMIELPLKHPELFDRLGIEAPKGVLLHGPPGTGKTLLAKAVANESGAYFINLAGPEIMSKWYGQSEENLRKKFEEAEKNAPSIVFLDEIDAIAPKREEVSGEVERRVVSQLLTLMDGLKTRGKVIVIAATNRPNAVDPALRRGGRFDREIEIGVPNKQGRKEVLQIHTRHMPLHEVDVEKLSERTHGFVGADIEALTKEAAMHALRRVLPEISELEDGKPISKEILEKLKVTKKDFEYGMHMVQPSAMREVLVEIPKVSWDDVGGLEDVKSNLKEAVEWPLTNPESFKKVGIKPPKGLLLYGPPGCGKTMIAKAVANEAGINFISIKGPEIFSKWVGESEKMVRKIFRRAKQVAPSIIFIDEIDSVAPKRGTQTGAHVTEQVVSQMLTEMSGLEDLTGVVVMAATNRPDMIDPALLRPGRFDKLIYVSAPDEKARLKIFQVHTKNMPLKNVDLKSLADKTEGYSGADVEAICREAAMFALRENIDAKQVTAKQFDEALKKVKPSITDDMFAKYQKVVDNIKKTKIDEESARYIG